MAVKLADYIEELCSNLNSVRKSRLDDEYLGERATYTGSPLTHDLLCDIELIDLIISDTKLRKVAGLDELTSEHLKCCHPAFVLTKLFNIMLKCDQGPENFGNSYTGQYVRAITFVAEN